MRARLTLAAGTAALALAGSVFAAAPALAVCTTASGDVCSGTTVATFTLTGGTLQISVPSGTSGTPDTLGGATGVAGSSTSVSGALGAVSVSDQRAALAAAWTVSVASTAFTTGTASTQETVANTLIGYNPGTALAAVKTGTGTLTPVNAPALGASTPVASWAGVGVNTASWNPTLTFTLLPNQVAGTYEGTITHSLV